jgi:hypothetical protein
VLHQYFCCAPGLVGTVAGKCADADTISVSNPQALQVYLLLSISSNYQTD